MPKWISVDERLPVSDTGPYQVVTDARPDRPVFAHAASENYQLNFPYAGFWLGRWREAILIGDHMREQAKVTYWLDEDETPEPPEDQELG